MLTGNIFSKIPTDLSAERFDTLFERGDMRLERIVSRGHATPEGEWYDQNQDEWVVVLQGRASLVIEGRSAPVDMIPGDYVLLPAHRRHRVAWTDPDQDTVWLAVHYPSV